MRSDLDQYMAVRELDAFIIPASENEDSYQNYLTGGVKAHAMTIKKRGEAPVLIVNHMEIDEAKKSGLEVLTYDTFNLTEISKQYGRGTPAARLELWRRILAHFHISGHLTFYGKVDMQTSMRLIEMIQEFEDITLVTDDSPDIFALAAETKDPDELEKLRDVGKATGTVIREMREWLSTHRAQDGQIVGRDGKPLTIGMVKRRLWGKLLEQGLEDPGGVTIFAQGRDAGVPHSRGEADDVLRPGETIIFDLFPRSMETGYYHDMTRTWCLGYAPDHIQKEFNLVLDVFYRSLEGINPGEPTRDIDRQVCEWFEAAGHPTRLNSPNTQQGYVHSLGHGLGLEIHESPGVGYTTLEKVVFRPGNVVTIEPGLYYPDKGYGIRVEDTVYLDEAGQIHNLTECPYDLVVPLKG